MFKLRPYRGFLITALFVLIVGGLLTDYLYAEDDSGGAENHHWLFALFGTLLLVMVLVVAAFSRYSFKHLRHHRPGYKRG